VKVRSNFHPHLKSVRPRACDSGNALKLKVTAVTPALLPLYPILKACTISSRGASLSDPALVVSVLTS